MTKWPFDDFRKPVNEAAASAPYVATTPTGRRAGEIWEALQKTEDPSEVLRLKDELSRLIFGKGYAED